MVWHEAGKIGDWSLGQGRELLIAGRVVAIFRTDEQQFFAIDGMCAHQGGPIAQGKLDRNCITCPWHGWQYNIADGVNLLTQKKMLDCFPVEIRDDVVWIGIE
ncbi:MAG: Rieske (2Fe-2S) protein [Pirellulaceae bacterium]|nr:Rieske (2Fe-2S) protein [Pirellulaceae bacterium]